MTKIKALLVDDEPRGLTSLQKLLEMNCPEVEVVSTCTETEEAKNIILQQQPELVFLDINMPGKNGFDFLRELPKINFEIIFVTAHNNYMIQAFQYSAVDYLLKPVEEYLLIEAVKRAAKRIEQNGNSHHIETLMHNLRYKGMAQKIKLCIPSIKGFQVVEISDIIYCEAVGNYTNFYFATHSPICASKLIHDYEVLLEDCNIVRIHKSFMVNLEHLKEYIRGEGGSVILSNGKELDVSRRKKDLLMTRIKDFYKY